MTHPLLTPRYMVEADYPNSLFRVGDVLTVHIDLPYKGNRTCMKGKYDRYNTAYIDEPTAQQYPHIFRPMHWSEQRELSELPRWIKDAHNGHIIVIKDWNTEIKSSRFQLDITHYTPATEAEYLEYLKSKNNESI